MDRLAWPLMRRKNVYVTNYSGSGVLRYAAGSYSSTPANLAAPGQLGIALAGDGSIYTVYGQNTLYRYTRTTNPALSFANTAVGATSTAQTTLLENDGNAAADDFVHCSLRTNNFTFAGVSRRQQRGLWHDAGYGGRVRAVCGNVQAADRGLAAVSASGVVTDNSLNVSGATQDDSC